VSARGLRSREATILSVLVPLGLLGGVVAIGAGGGPSLEASVTLILCNLIIVCGLQVFIGNSGVYSFGQISFAAIGAYMGALVTLPAAFAAIQTPALPGFLVELPVGPVALIFLCGGASALLAVCVGSALLRTSTAAIPITTFAFLLVTYTVTANWEGLTGGSAGLVDVPTDTTVVVAGAFAALAVVAALAFKWSASGYRVQATREDEVAARSLGIGVFRVRLYAFVISAALCGLGGALTAHESGVLTPNSFYFDATVTTLTMIVVGGTRSVLGAVVGALAVATVNEALRSLEEGARLFGLVSIGETPGLAAIGLGLILLGTIIAMPDGVTGGREAGELVRLPRRRSGLRASEPSGVGGRTQRRTVVAGSLEVEKVSVAFAGLEVLRNVDLRLDHGEVLGLIGPNGAGKTTLVNVLSGFQRPDTGTVHLDGVDITGWAAPRLARAGLARSFQAALPFRRLSALEGVAIGAMGVGMGRREAVAHAAALLARLGLGADARSPAGALPPARQRLLGVARAMATGPRYLLLDEPAAGLSEAEREDLLPRLSGLLGEVGCGALVIEHDMNFVGDLCTRVQVIDDGATVTVDTPARVQGDPAVIEAYLGSGFLAGADA
jgi:branched-chain amino acid transport system permease protein